VANRSELAKQIMATGSAQTETLNFKVPSEFKKEFKGFAVSQGVTMLELLKEGFERSKQERAGK
jgi:hypothetical protein